ncbi:unknown [Prevotella sp. CAG:617]|nr:unknown [Prevotella sp. CAG:617]
MVTFMISVGYVACVALLIKGVMKLVKREVRF